MEKYVYQMFILGLGNHIEALKKGLGGVIFFAKDIQSEDGLKSKIGEIKDCLSPHPNPLPQGEGDVSMPPFISIDQEGGRVERTEAIRSKRLSARYAYEKGDKYLKEQSEEISKELSDWGFNLNFAPCIDVNTNPNNPIIGERSFSDNPDEVIKGADIFLQASRKYGIIPCVKHYPGHGDADKDSHLTLPQINLSLAEMEKTHIKPFKWAVENNVEMVMAAHLHCSCFDKEPIPASLSQNAISYLRNKLNYQGVIISDDMVMKGVQAYGSLQACIMGINAGLDMFIFRDSTPETISMIDELVKAVENNTALQEKVMKSYERITALKSRL